MSKFVAIVLSIFLSQASRAAYAYERVPAIFTGNSPAPEYQNYSKYKNKADSRDSTNFAEYYLDTALINQVTASEGINSMHAHVRDIARDGLCKGTCFRVYVYLNGDRNDGWHVATFVVSPGTGSSTPTVTNRSLRRYTRSLTSFERPTQFANYDMYRIYGSKSYPESIANMPNAMFFMNAIALHGSFDKVDGTKRSHGCIRMFPDESYFVHSLAIEAGGNMTFDVLHTR